MPTVNYLQVIGCEHDKANWNEGYGKDHRNGNMKLMKPTYIPSIKVNLQRWQIALALISHLEVHGAIEWQQSKMMNQYKVLMTYKNIPII